MGISATNARGRGFQFRDRRVDDVGDNMISLLQPLHVEYKDDTFSVVLCLCEPFNQQFSFRATLSQIEQILCMSAQVAYSLPPEQPEEDFVEGSFCWECRDFSLYFERSLGYMQFSSPIQADAQALQLALSPNTTVNTAPFGRSGVPQAADLLPSRWRSK